MTKQTTEERIEVIAAEAVRLRCCPADTSAFRADLAFGRAHSGQVWDAISAKKAGKKPAESPLPKPEPDEPDNPLDPENEPNQDELSEDEPDEEDEEKKTDGDEDEDGNEDEETDTLNNPEQCRTNHALFSGKFFGYPQIDYK